MITETSRTPAAPAPPPARPRSTGTYGAGRFHTWRAAFRIARRDAWRYKGRSVLVLAMIALPILAVSAADITIRSSQLTVRQQLARDIGAADARLSSSYNGRQPVYQSPSTDEWMPAPQGPDGQGSGSADSTAPLDPRVAIPRGARWISDQYVNARMRTKAGLLYASVRELKANDPIAAGITDLDRGRYPAAPDEMMATNAFLKSSGLHVGSRIRARDVDRTYRVVGAYDLPGDLKLEQINALPGSFIAAYEAARNGQGQGSGQDGDDAPSYLVSIPGDFTWPMVEEANTRGAVVLSRAVRLHPPARADVPLFRAAGGNDSVRSIGKTAALVIIPFTIAGLAILEICLLAGPAFAVGARRSRRQLGLVGANGGDRRHIRAIVLSGGLVIGLVAAVLGTLLGLGLTVALRGVLENYVGKRFGGISVHPLELLGIAGLAVLTGLLAAIVPAVNASRQSVLASLTGRRGVRHANRVLPVIGLGAVLLGGGIAVFSTMLSKSVAVVALGSAIAELGVVALTPTLVGLAGRLARWLPLSPRLALRDAVRNRGRTAPAVAAVLAAVAGTVAVATYAAGQNRQDEDAYQARLPHGVVSVSESHDQGRDLGPVRDLVARHFAVSGRADVSRMTAGKAGACDLSLGDTGCGSVTPTVPEANQCPLELAANVDALTSAQRRHLSGGWRCGDHGGGLTAMDSEGGVLVGGPAVLHALGLRDAAAEQALARGESVIFDRVYDDHGKLDLQVTEDGSAATPTGPLKKVPAHLAAEHLPYGVTAVLPPEAVRAAGIKTVPLGSFFTTSRMPTGQERQAVDGGIADLASDAKVYVERGYLGHGSLVIIALTICAGLVTIGAAGIATGLAQADAEPDLKTLAAIGAAPGVRRRLTAFQCGLIATMGVVLGTAAGAVPAIGLRRAELRIQWRQYHEMLSAGYLSDQPPPHVPIVIPWSTFALLLVAVPLGAALLAALVTRSRSRLTRRAES